MCMSTKLRADDEEISTRCLALPGDRSIGFGWFDVQLCCHTAIAGLLGATTAYNFVQPPMEMSVQEKNSHRSIMDHPLIKRLAKLASDAALQCNPSYEAGLRGFHLFCDTFNIDKQSPASFATLHSFVLWVASNPDCLNADTCGLDGMGPSETNPVQKARQYLSAVTDWHMAQGWSSPLTKENLVIINWSLRGIENLQASTTRSTVRPPRGAPITLPMLRTIEANLNLENPFDACVWAAAACAFWGMMKFSEVTVQARASFSGTIYLKRRDASCGRDDEGKRFIEIRSPNMSKPGEFETIMLVSQSDACAVRALRNLATVVPAQLDDPLFSWRDYKGDIRLLTVSSARKRIKSVLGSGALNMTFEHSFRMGGASFFLSQGVSPEKVRQAGRWKPLDYDVYVRGFEQTGSTQKANLDPPSSDLQQVGGAEENSSHSLMDGLVVTQDQGPSATK